MVLAPLAARLDWLVPTVMTEPPRLPTADEWTARFSELERLYVYERRRLRDVMQFMEGEHGFKATQQMYKKRFARWGFQKNGKRSLASVQTLATEAGRRKPAQRQHKATGELRSIACSLPLGEHDRLMLSFLTNMQKWSSASLESGGAGVGSFECPRQCSSKGQIAPSTTKEITLSLKLVGDLLDRGHGAMAGRVARKAFLMMEALLTLDGPAFIWNLLEIIYHMVARRQDQLLKILLEHLIALSTGQISKRHPLSIMLHDLRTLITRLACSKQATENCSINNWSSSLPSPRPASNVPHPIPPQDNIFCTISHLLQEAWILNARTVFDHFDPSFIQLYRYLDWESSSIGLPPNIIRLVKEWLMHIEVEARQKPCAVADVYHKPDVVPINCAEEEEMLRSLLSPRIDASPPQDYERLRTRSLATLRRLGETMLSKGKALQSGDDSALRLVPLLIKAKVLEKPFDVDLKASSPAAGGLAQVSRSQAAVLALVMRSLVDLNSEHGGDGIAAIPAAVGCVQSIVVLREYAFGETDPQVVREMWLLEEALVAIGEYAQAEEIGQSVICRLKKYTQDIPPDSV